VESAPLYHTQHAVTSPSSSLGNGIHLFSLPSAQYLFMHIKIWATATRPKNTANVVSTNGVNSPTCDAMQKMQHGPPMGHAVTPERSERPAGARINWLPTPASQTLKRRPPRPGRQATCAGSQDGCCLYSWSSVLAQNANWTVACLRRNGLDGCAVSRRCVYRLCQHVAGAVCLRW